MRCEKCDKEMLEAGEEFRYAGSVMCEDCYMDAISPPKACDPWAAYIAKSSMSSSHDTSTILNDKQAEILAN